MNYLTEHNIFIFLVQIFLLLGLSRVFGEILRFWKQPTLTAEIFVGVLLGPTILGRFFPALHQGIFPADIPQRVMLETVGWLGAFFLLLETGLEIDFSSAWRQRGEALKIALIGIIVPMLLAFSLCFLLPEHYLVDPQQKIIFALFMATAMAISAMPVVARALHDLHLSKTDLGFLIMSAFSVNDIVGWLIFTLVLGLFMHVDMGLFKNLLIFSATIGFTTLCLTVGRNFANSVILKMKQARMPEPSSSLTFICLLGLLCGAVTQKLGIHALFGFFIAGIMAGEAKALSERTRQVISQMVFAVFVPFFFTGIGLRVDFLKNFDPFLVAFVTVVGVTGRFLGGWLGVVAAKVSRANRLSVAIAHTPGGAMEIVIGVLALQYHLITEAMFIAIVCGAIISVVILGPWLSYSIRRRKEVSVLEFFSRRTVMAQLKSADRDHAIRELCEVVVEEEGMYDADNLTEAVLQRENIMGTAIEEGIALPHARIRQLVKPIIAFGRSPVGIEWDSPDGKLTQCIFLILTPHEDDDIQVQILRAIATIMNNKETAEGILQAISSEDIWSLLHKSLTSLWVIRK
ncbi:MAG: hypothetical protein A3D10_03325 [Omnitrophica WOR_2 bacterium RIFCSPHIGHO2_02_FULL_48_11]|nr:MAG: hypothetical protein A3D10_03325 [Omnitrophica WOR_2 bacterium RIFCSPHIGHO2_02_FULL_48_11]